MSANYICAPCSHGLLAVFIGLQLTAFVVVEVAAGTTTFDSSVNASSSAVKKELYYPEGSGSGSLASLYACPIGCTGPKGNKGFAGHSGRRGRKGDRGFMGPPATTPRYVVSSLKQYKGEKGDLGIEGLSGFPGSMGPGGEKGEKGSPGVPGKPGRKGDKGISGRPGLPGTPGDEGYYGAPGDGGLLGRQGEPGSKGFKGARGENGIPGNPGLVGVLGEKGSSGIHGMNGTKGLKGIKGSKGLKGDAGMDGERGLKGFKGSNGQKGSKGLEGAPGMPGVNGTSEKGEVGPPIEMMLINKDTCTDQLLGEVRYDPGQKSLYYCNGRQWRCVRHKPVTGVVCLDFFGDKIREGEEYFVINTGVRRLSSEACVVTLVDVALEVEASQWLPRVIESLDSFLRGSQVGSRYPNHYALAQFGFSNGQSRITSSKGDNIWFLATQFGAVLNSGDAGVVTVDGVSDGYNSLQLVLDTMDFPKTCIPLIILVTGKRRSVASRSLDYNSVLQSLEAKNMSLTVIGDTGFTMTIPGGKTKRGVFGLDSSGAAYSLVADDLVGTNEGAVVIRNERTACEIFNDYGVLALNADGAVWDKEVIRSSTVATQTMCRIISKRIIISERLCERCACKDNGLGEPDTQCISERNIEFCQCRSLIGGTVESCAIHLQTSANTFHLNTSSIAPVDCSTMP